MTTDKTTATIVYGERGGAKEPIAVILQRPAVDSRARVFMLEDASPDDIAGLITNTHPEGEARITGE